MNAGATMGNSARCEVAMAVHLDEILDAAIAEAGTSRWEVASRLCADRRQGYRIMSGEQRMSARYAVKLGGLLRIDPMALLIAAARDELDQVEPGDAL